MEEEVIVTVKQFYELVSVHRTFKLQAYRKLIGNCFKYDKSFYFCNIKCFPLKKDNVPYIKFVGNKEKINQLMSMDISYLLK